MNDLAEKPFVKGDFILGVLGEVFPEIRFILKREIQNIRDEILGKIENNEAEPVIKEFLKSSFEEGKKIKEAFRGILKKGFVGKEEGLELYLERFINVIGEFYGNNTSFYSCCRKLNIFKNPKLGLDEKDNLDIEKLALLLENIDASGLKDVVKSRIEEYSHFVSLDSKFSPSFETEKGRLLRESPEYRIIFGLKRAEIKEEFLKQPEENEEGKNKSLSKIAYNKALDFLNENSLPLHIKDGIFQYFIGGLNLTNEQSVLNAIKVIIVIGEFSGNDKSFYSCCKKLNIFKTPGLGLDEKDNVNIGKLTLLLENIGINGLSDLLKQKLEEYNSYVILDSKSSGSFEREKIELLKKNPEYEIIFDLKRAEIKEEFLKQAEENEAGKNKILSEIANNKAKDVFDSLSLDNTSKEGIYEYFRSGLNFTNEQSTLNAIKVIVVIIEFSGNDKSFYSCGRKLKIDINADKKLSFDLKIRNNVDIGLLILFVENIDIDKLSPKLRSSLSQYESYLLLGSKSSGPFERAKGKLLRDNPEYRFIFDLKRAEIKKKFMEQAEGNGLTKGNETGENKLSQIALEEARLLFREDENYFFTKGPFALMDVYFRNEKIGKFKDHFTNLYGDNNNKIFLSTLNFIYIISNYTGKDKGFFKCFELLNIDPRSTHLSDEEEDILALFVEIVGVEGLSDEFVLELAKNICLHKDLSIRESVFNPKIFRKGILMQILQIHRDELSKRGEQLYLQLLEIIEPGKRRSKELMEIFK